MTPLDSILNLITEMKLDSSNRKGRIFKVIDQMDFLSYDDRTYLKGRYERGK